jgi:His Kinase A (phospho-acceptor) domain/Histidine kinase-, DNA gyrase B-, and HSP90-like ATPase
MCPPGSDPDAEDQDRLKSELVATVSHEMRRPLTAILGFSQTLRTRWESLPNQLRGELLERVEQNAQAMSHMIGQVLDFSRLQLGEFQIDLRPLEVEPLVTRVLGNLGGQVADHVIRTRGEEAVRVLTEPYAFERILGNLVANAAKFAPGGTTIEVGWVAEGETVRLWVRDEGPGVPEPEREKVFERFYRVRRTGPGARLDGFRRAGSRWRRRRRVLHTSAGASGCRDGRGRPLADPSRARGFGRAFPGTKKRLSRAGEICYGPPRGYQHRKFASSSSLTGSCAGGRREQGSPHRPKEGGDCLWQPVL